MLIEDRLKVTVVGFGSGHRRSWGSNAERGVVQGDDRIVPTLDLDTIRVCHRLKELPERQVTEFRGNLDALFVENPVAVNAGRHGNRFRAGEGDAEGAVSVVGEPYVEQPRLLLTRHGVGQQHPGGVLVAPCPFPQHSLVPRLEPLELFLKPLISPSTFLRLGSYAEA